MACIYRDIEEKGYPTKESFDFIFEDNGRFHMDIAYDEKIYWDFYYDLWKNLDWKKQFRYREVFEEMYPKMIERQSEETKKLTSEYNEKNKRRFFWLCFESSWGKFEHIENPDEREEIFLKELSNDFKNVKWN